MMPGIEEHFLYLLKQVQQGTATTAEYRELREQLLADTSGEIIQQANSFLGTAVPGKELIFHDWQESLQQILAVDKRISNAIPTPARGIATAWRRAGIAASILLVLAAGALFFYKNKPERSLTLHASQPVNPGGNKATLTLADGRTIVLDNTLRDTVANENGIQVINLSAGLLSWKDNASAGDNQVTAMNVLTTPKGGQYQLLLPDGSHVWLNSASSLRFPASFKGDSREVMLSGEAYFEVAQNAHQPFMVKTGDRLVQVLGTGFNVMAYNDEPAFQATLITGSIRVTALAAKQASVVLSPGEQALFSYSKERLSVTEPDLKEVLAWRDGAFRFNNANITTIMRQLSRWYDVEVMYEGPVSQEQFYGYFSKRKEVTQILNALAHTHNVQFKTEGKKITVIATAK